LGSPPSVLADGRWRIRFVPGQRLVDADLTRDLGVGRNTLREALSRLSITGPIVVEPG
jgi:DNA-binding GntR family transcriptional regulator